MRLDIVSKLAFVALMWVCAFTLPWAVNGSLIFLLILVRYSVPSYKPVSKKAASAFNKFFGYAVTLSIVLIILNALLIRKGGVFLVVQGISLYEEGLLFGLTTAIRLLLLSFAVLSFFISIQFSDFVRFLQKAGLPASLVLILFLTLHFLEQLPKRIEQIFVAQEARGAPIKAGLFSRAKALFAILSPLLLSSIVESIDRGAALELRGFFLKNPSASSKSTMKITSSPLALLFLVIAMLLIIISVGQWLRK